jgi:hypothetical protein
MAKCIVDYFNSNLNTTIAAASGLVPVIAQAYMPYYYFINNISGYNPGTNTYTVSLVYVDELQSQIPINIQSVATTSAFNNVIQKYFRPDMGVYISVTAASYPVSPAVMVDGYLFTLDD